MYPQMKVDVMVNNESVTAAATSLTYLDTKGFDRAKIDVVGTPITTPSNTPSVLKFSEGDAGAISSMTDIAALTGHATNGFTVADASATDAPYRASFNLNLLNVNGRYLGLSISPLEAQTLTVIANLYRAKDAPETAAKAGVETLVEF